MRVALDTNRYRDLCEGQRAVVTLLERADAVFVPFVVLAELRAGFAVGGRGRENERVLRRFLNEPGVDLLFASDATTRAYAELYRQLRTQGTPIPTNDLWIAALVVEHDLYLCSRDEHFRHLPQLTVV
ncbi:MAG: type II toxin-antitoxin system VapC family toxin [Deltaproteobacteria bacterium]|nr:type II toxin-antitoxin system VapC family toxin [Deltaproteobacteria bacterium]